MFHLFAALTREIFFNIRREISYLRAAMEYALYMSLASTVFGHRARAVGVNAALVVLTGKDSSQ